MSFGPRHGAVSALQVENAVRRANRTGADDLIFAGFAFDAPAQSIIDVLQHENVQLHKVHINPDVEMGDLLKETRSDTFFTVSGSPRVDLDRSGNGTFVVHMRGVDAYDPVTNRVVSFNPNDVAAWFVDTDYDERTFCPSQAFFPNRDAWRDMKRDLKNALDPSVFETFSGSESLPFEGGEHGRVAVKVIDRTGHELMAVLDLD